MRGGFNQYARPPQQSAAANTGSPGTVASTSQNGNQSNNSSFSSSQSNVGAKQPSSVDKSQGAIPKNTQHGTRSANYEPWGAVGGIPTNNTFTSSGN